MWDRTIARCVPLTSALGNQIPSHNFFPLLRNVNQKGKGNEFCFWLTFCNHHRPSISIPGKSASNPWDEHPPELGTAVANVLGEEQTGAHLKPAQQACVPRQPPDCRDELLLWLMVTSSERTLRRSCASGPGSSLRFSSVNTC